MKNLKKLMSVILTVAMLMSLVATSVGAATFTDVDETSKAYEAIEVLAALEILEGKEEGNFDPEADIKRSEFAAVICRAMNQEAAAAGSTGASKFVDVSGEHWALGYINWAADQGIVNGKGEGKFDPDAPVTYQEAVKMIVCALGFGPLAEKRGGYPTGYMVIASNYEITDGVAMTPATANATRAGVAQLVYNAFDAPLMEEAFVMSYYDDAYKIYDGSKSVDYEKKTLLSEYHGIWKIRASVADTYRSDPANLLNTKTGDMYIDLLLHGVYGFDAVDFLDGWYDETELTSTLLQAGVAMSDVVANNPAFADYLGYNVNAFVTINEDDDIELIAMVPDTKNFDIVEIESVIGQSVVAAISSGVPSFSYYEEGETKATVLDLASLANVTVYKNGVEVGTLASTGAAVFTGLTGNDDVASLVLTGSDDEYNKIFITEYEYGIVEELEAELNFIGTDNNAYDLSEDNDYLLAYNIYKDGAAIGIEDIQIGDLLNVAVGQQGGSSDYILDIYVTNNTVEGSISEVDDAEGIYYIDGTGYYSVGESWKAGTTGEFYVTIDGRLYDAEVSRDFTGNFGYILNIAEDRAGFGESYQIKVLTKDNAITTFKWASSLKVDQVVSGTPDTYETITYKAGNSSANKQSTLYTNILASVDVINNVAYDTTLTATDINNEIANLFITYKASGDTMSAMAFVDTTGDSDFNMDTLSATYNKDKNKMGSAGYTTSGTVIFDLAPVLYEDVDHDEDAGTAEIDYYAINEDKIQVYSTSRLKDEQPYAGYVFAVDENNDEIGAMVVTSGMGSVTSENALAVVRSISSGLNAAGESADMLNVWQGSEFVSYPESSKLTYDLDNLDAGDVVQVAVNAAGEVDDVTLIYDFDLATKAGELQIVSDGFDVRYAAGVVTNHKNGVDLEASTTGPDRTFDLGWALAEGGTNVIFDVTRAATSINNAFSGQGTTSYVRENINENDGTYLGDAYILVVKCNDDDEIEDVVAYKYAAYGEALSTIKGYVTVPVLA
ncbi:MAG: S-layer homology domain-containing protein [Ruminococcaceae bacterium]|nr:S-layer homology domain-containing protein [Oscillospiraceae bacterium]